jgi:hypothetical protein
LLLNLPAIPAAVLYSAVLEEPTSKLMTAYLFFSEAVISSLVWGLLPYIWLERKARKQRKSRGVPVDTESRSRESSQKRK